MDRAEYLHRKRVAHFNCLDDGWVESGKPPTTAQELFASKGYQDGLRDQREQMREGDERALAHWREVLARAQ